MHDSHNPGWEIVSEYRFGAWRDSSERVAAATSFAWPAEPFPSPVIP